jgi:hypothetical protein
MKHVLYSFSFGKPHVVAVLIYVDSCAANRREIDFNRIQAALYSVTVLIFFFFARGKASHLQDQV